MVDFTRKMVQSVPHTTSNVCDYPTKSPGAMHVQYYLKQRDQGGPPVQQLNIEKR